MKQSGLIILASQSQARRRLLHGAGLDFKSVAADLDEMAIRDRMQQKGDTVSNTAIILAQEKALFVSKTYPDHYIIGADQILDLAGQLFEKPGNLQEARQQLQQLCGRTHRLHNAVCVIKDHNILWSHVSHAHMSMRKFDTDFLEDYLNAAGPEIFHCVGSYQLEGLGAHLFDDIDGDYFSILGLPLLALLSFLRKIDVIH